MIDLNPKATPESFTKYLGTLEYMPPEVQGTNTGKHTNYDTSLDVFSFGHLALFTLIQSDVHVLPHTYSDSEGDHYRSEVKRRDKSICRTVQMLRETHPLVELIERCLHNRPAQRPHTEKIVSILNSVAEGNDF